MSLINDALRRAKESQRKNNPSGAAPLSPIPARDEEQDFSWILPVIIVLLIVVAVFFIAKSTARHAEKKIIAAPDNSTTQQVESVRAPAPPPVVIGPAAIVAPPPEPTTRIQGIAYDSVHPWAIVSGKTVYVGDSVEGMVVTEIARNSITLTGKGQTNKLYVGQQ
jgi:hypothetical protein